MTLEKPPLWFWPAAGLGLAWNIYGVAQYVGSVTATPESLVAGGMTPQQAAVMLTYPWWMTAAFALGTFGGTLGCALLLLRRQLAMPVFAVSLAAYVVLYLGDITQGVFAALGAPQIAVLSLVVVVAAALLKLARHAANRNHIA